MEKGPVDAPVMADAMVSKQTGYAPRRQYDHKGASPLCSMDALASGKTAANISMGKVILTNHGAKSKKDKIAELSAATSLLAIEEALKLSRESTHLNDDSVPDNSNLSSQHNKSDSNGRAVKTPVSILQEILSRRGITPSYELVQIEGAIHEPTFRYRVSFNDKDVPFTAMGAGRSKKEAKHSAARALIDKLTGLQIPETENGITNTNPDGSVSTTVTNDANSNVIGTADSGDKVVGNPIGWLQEMCMSRRWPPPSYETETEVGLPHERLFTISCSILNYREVGKGKSKKIAKRLAAHKMWTRLQENPLDNNHTNDNDEENRDCANYYGDLKDINMPNLSSQHSSKVSQFHKTLKNSCGKRLLKLQKTCLKNPKLDYVKLLGEIAHENQFEVTYVDIEEKSYTNEFQCLVQLSSFPVGVCHGYGSTAADAQRKAAQNALEYLKIMTKK